MEDSILIYEPDSRLELAYYGDQLADAFPGLTVALAGTIDEALEHAPSHTVLVAKSVHVSRDLVAGMPRLAWLQSLISGTDHLMTVGVPKDVVVTAARGIHGPQMAELAILHMLAFARSFPRILKNQEQSKWQAWPQPLLLGKTAVIVGVGAIAEAVASRCAAFGMRVFGVSGRVSAPGFERLFPKRQLLDAAALADFLIVLIPLDDASRGLIGEDVFDAMPAGSCLVNIARGGVVDENALMDALETGSIAGAGIDVASVEPLPADSKLWRTSNLLITPHLGGRSDIYSQQVLPLLVSNIRLFLDGRPRDMPYQVTL